MGRPKQEKQLYIWMNGYHVGRWLLQTHGQQEYRYEDSWVKSKRSRALSLSMPIRKSNLSYVNDVVENFFDNLLPDSEEIRRRIQKRFSVQSIKPFDLLAEIGKDCVGALQLLPTNQKPKFLKTIKSKGITNKGIEKNLNETVSRPGIGQEDEGFRISLAGAQEKTAFLKLRGKWHIPQGSTPTTHIFKLPMGTVGNSQADMSTSVENEWLCSQIVKYFGIPVANCQIALFGKGKVLVVERFDRRWSPDKKWIMRLPQEDMCQALAVSPSMKYENQGGPGILEIMKLLYGSQNPEADRKIFFKIQILFWMLAAPDGHAKNFSIFLKEHGEYSLTPIYDVISAYPIMGKGKNQIAPQKLRMAMYVHGKNKHDRWNKITKRHWLQTAKICGISNPEEIIGDLVKTTPEVISKVSKLIPADFPKQVATSILSGLIKATDSLK